MRLQAHEMGRAGLQLKSYGVFTYSNSQQQRFPTLNSVISRLIASRAPANDQHPAKRLMKKYPSHI